MRFVPLAVVGLLAGSACDNGKQHLHPEAGPDAPSVAWWRPPANTVKDWDVQLAAPFDVSANRVMYDLDLWAVATATTIDYGDGDPVTVPAGALAGKIAELHARMPATIVICHVSTGAIRLSDPDARKFPGYQSPNDRPTAPAAGSVVGWTTQDPRRPDEHFLDIRDASRDLWSAKIWKRLDLAKQLGCDGVEADRNDMVTSDPGWTIDVTEQTSWYREVAAAAHDRELSVGMKNGNTLPGQTDALASVFDWLMIERCGEFADCDSARPFLNTNRSVFAIDYQNTIDGTPQSTSGPCGRQQDEMIDTGLVKDDDLSSAFRFQCVP